MHVLFVQMEYTGVWSGYGDSQGDMHSWTHDEDIDGGPSGELFVNKLNAFICFYNLKYV